MYTHLFPCPVNSRVFRSNTSVETSTSNVHFLVSITILQPKEPGLPGEQLTPGLERKHAR